MDRMSEFQVSVEAPFQQHDRRPLLMLGQRNARLEQSLACFAQADVGEIDQRHGPQWPLGRRNFAIGLARIGREDPDASHLASVTELSRRRPDAQRGKRVARSSTSTQRPWMSSARGSKRSQKMWFAFERRPRKTVPSSTPSTGLFMRVHRRSENGKASRGGEPARRER